MALIPSKIRNSPVLILAQIAIWFPLLAYTLFRDGNPEVAYAMLGIGTFLFIVCFLGFFFLRNGRKQPNPMAILAESLGMEFIDRDPTFAKTFAFLDKLAKGYDRFAFNIIRGNYQGHKTILSHYHYQTGDDSKGSQHCSVLIIDLPRSVPELIVFKEDAWSKVAQFLGYEDIDFESAEFSRKFVVRSSDKKFAYEFCHPQMIKYFLENPDLQVELERDVLMLFFKKRFSTDEFRANLARILEIKKMIPDHVFE